MGWTCSTKCLKAKFTSLFWEDANRHSWQVYLEHTWKPSTSVPKQGGNVQMVIYHIWGLVLLFFFFFACRAPNEQDKWQMHYEDSKVQLSTDLYWWPLNGEMRTVRASLMSLPETIVLVAVLLHSRIKKEKSPQVRCLLWGWALGLVLNSAATAE